jgi:hypothetical protein
MGHPAFVDGEIKSKFGNSLGVVLPRQVISRLRSAHGAYQLTPYDPNFEKSMAKAEDIMKRYRNTLHVLARLRRQTVPRARERSHCRIVC